MPSKNKSNSKKKNATNNVNVSNVLENQIKDIEKELKKKNLSSARRSKLNSDLKTLKERKKSRDKETEKKLKNTQKALMENNKLAFSMGMGADLEDEDIEIKSLIKDAGDLTGIEGMPYQFTNIVDQRIDGFPIGRKFNEKIYSRMPLVFLTPCKQKFMSDFDDTDKATVLGFIGDGAPDFDEDILGGDSGERKKYYSTEWATDSYYNYLNPMMVAMATFLGIGDYQIKVGDQPRKAINTIDWSRDTNANFKRLFSAKQNLVFYADSLNSVSESFSNDLMDSSLASTINGYSDKAKELRFLLGSNAAETDNFLAKAASGITSSLASGVGTILSGLGAELVGSLAKNGVNTIMNGGKIVFPKLWSDSSHSTSYSISFKFRSPDKDPLSIYLNILKPYAKLLAFVMPHADADDPINGYNTPFLVKATAPGFFNIDMGMITSMSVTKGDEGQWTDDGLPTVLDVQLDIEDMYAQVIYMSNVGESHFSFNFPANAVDTYKFVCNTTYMDFLANTCGLNIHKPYAAKILATYGALVKHDVLTFPTRIATRFDTGISNAIGRLYNLF